MMRPSAAATPSSDRATQRPGPAAVRYLLGALLAFAALNAFAGGSYGLAGAQGVPREWLRGSPFTDYFVPSLILVVVVGGSFLLATVAVFARWRSSRRRSFLAGWPSRPRSSATCPGCNPPRLSEAHWSLRWPGSCHPQEDGDAQSRSDHRTVDADLEQNGRGRDRVARGGRARPHGPDPALATLEPSRGRHPGGAQNKGNPP